MIKRFDCGAVILIFLVTGISIAEAQDASRANFMTQARLQNIIVETGTDVLIAENIVRFTFGGRELMCISDQQSDRMRLVSPIAELAEVEVEQLLTALAANFHTVLDARYAISDGMVYAVYIHPLSPLSEVEVLSAIAQVARASETFGEEYSSGALFFPAQ